MKPQSIRTYDPYSDSGVIRAVLYLRYSALPASDTNADEQAEKIAAYAESLAWQPIPLYDDEFASQRWPRY